MTKNKGSLSANARLVTGAAMGALGGMAFVMASYISRLENLSIMQVTTDAVLFEVAPRADRLYRMVERNTEQLFALQTVGVVFLAIGVAFLFSILTTEKAK
jgi:hypothetical protein